MREYIIAIVGATLLSALSTIIAPEKWRGYVRIITGLVIISCIVSPVSSVIKSDIFNGFEISSDSVIDGSNLQTELIVRELSKRVNEDIEARMKKEFNLSVTAECEIRVNDEGEIAGVDNVRVSGDKLTDRARMRLCEVYGLKPYEVNDE
ncbi:MAG: stage III sporulation protein AF [Oscillospiraceae bacterium]|nr:stage III sporulation protein AF [Oscillospiraceae bacterium]